MFNFHTKSITLHFPFTFLWFWNKNQFTQSFLLSYD